jgi:hypothetical protein
MPEDRVRVLRLIEYDGPRTWVEDSVTRSIHGRRQVGFGTDGPGYITGVTITQFPEILERAREIDHVEIEEPSK